MPSPARSQSQRRHAAPAAAAGSRTPGGAPLMCYTRRASARLVWVAKKTAAAAAAGANETRRRQGSPSSSSGRVRFACSTSGKYRSRTSNASGRFEWGTALLVMFSLGVAYFEILARWLRSHTMVTVFDLGRRRSIRLEWSATPGVQWVGGRQETSSVAP